MLFGKIGAKNQLMVGLFIALPFIYLAIFYAYPIVKVILLSLREYQPGYGYDEFIGLRHYQEILTDPESRLIILRTFIYTGICVTASLILGLLWAQLTMSIEDHFSRRWSVILRQIIIMPMIFIPAAAGVMWSFAYTEHYGWINHVLSLLGLRTYPWMVSNAAFYLVMITDVWGWTPFMYLILLAGMQTLPVEPIEAALADGASAWQRFFRIILPMLRPVMIIAIIIKTLDTYRAFDYLWIMTEGGPGTISTTLNIATYKIAFRNMEFGRASAYGLITLLFPLILVNLFLIFSKKRQNS